MTETNPVTDLLTTVRGHSREAVDLVTFTASRYYNDNCFQTAAALTYTSLLAMVPLMTIGFAIFSAFPAFGHLQAQAQQMLFKNLVPTVGDAMVEYLARFMANAGQLTAFGVIGLAISAVLLLETIEGSFSAIWRVTEPRSLIVRLLSFWAIVTLTPLLFGASLSVSGTLLAALHLDTVSVPLAGFSVALPGLFEFLGCSLLYVVIPNRPIRWQDAGLGGIAAALLLELSKLGFGWYLMAFPAYQTIYGALSTIPIFLVWLYIAWSTVLFGAEITAAMPEWRSGKILRTGPEGLLPAQRLAVALAVLHELMAASRLGVGLRRRTLVHRVPLGTILIDGTLEQLREAHWVARTTRDAWVCTRDLSEATLHDLQKALGIGLRGTVRGVAGMETPWQERCATLLEAAEHNNQHVLGISIKDLLMPPEERGGEAGAVPLRRRAHAGSLPPPSRSGSLSPRIDPPDRSS